MVIGFTKRELTKRWQCSERHIDRMIRSGKLTTFNIGVGTSQQAVRIHAESVSAIEQPSTPDRKTSDRRPVPMKRHV